MTGQHLPQPPHDRHSDDRHRAGADGLPSPRNGTPRRRRGGRLCDLRLTESARGGTTLAHPQPDRRAGEGR